MIEFHQTRHLDRQIEKRLEQLPKVQEPQTEQLYTYKDLCNVEKLMYHEHWEQVKEKHAQTK